MMPAGPAQETIILGESGPRPLAEGLLVRASHASCQPREFKDMHFARRLHFSEAQKGNYDRILIKSETMISSYSKGNMPNAKDLLDLRQDLHDFFESNPAIIEAYGE